jgi:prevent-host-death family protein
MLSVKIYEAKAKPSALVQVVERGKEVIITNRNRPVARLVPAQALRERPVFGSAWGHLCAPGWPRRESPRHWRP